MHEAVIVEIVQDDEVSVRFKGIKVGAHDHNFLKIFNLIYVMS